MSKIALGAAAGSVMTFVFSAVRTSLDQRRKRRAVATALLAEQDRLQQTFSRYERVDPEMATDIALGYVRSPVHDRVADYVELFKPQTVQFVLAYAHEIDRYRACFPRDSNAKSREACEHLQRHAYQILDVHKHVQAWLIGEGAIRLKQPVSEQRVMLRAVLRRLREQDAGES